MSAESFVISFNLALGRKLPSLKAYLVWTQCPSFLPSCLLSLPLSSFPPFHFLFPLKSVRPQQPACTGTLVRLWSCLFFYLAYLWVLQGVQGSFMSQPSSPHRTSNETGAPQGTSTNWCTTSNTIQHWTPSHLHPFTTRQPGYTIYISHLFISFSFSLLPSPFSVFCFLFLFLVLLLQTSTTLLRDNRASHRTQAVRTLSSTL